MKTVEETRVHSYQCFKEGLAEIDAGNEYVPAWEKLASAETLHPPHASILKEDNEVYFERASELTALEAGDLMVRMNAKLFRLMSKDSSGALLALAMQLKREDGDLQWWRKRVEEMRGLPTHSIDNPS
jgi:hypothetical protein